jgi:transcription elongation factor Elf1
VIPQRREKRKPKRSRVRLWCPGGGVDVGFQYDDESRKLALTPEKRKVKYVRCGVCGQRFEVHNRECHDAGCVHQRVPRHKAY